MQPTPTRIGATAPGSAKLRVWVTRAQPGADETAERLSRLGHQPLVAPVLEVRPLAIVAPDLQGVAAIAFTSANAVRLFAELSPARALPVFAVGEATASAARAVGFAEVHAAAGDVASLAERLASAGANHDSRPPVPPLRSGGGGPPKAGEGAASRTTSRPDWPAAHPHGEILHVRGRDVAGDLAGALTAHGLRVRDAILYETVEADALPEAVAQAIRDGALAAVLIHSPKAARVVARLLDGAGADLSAGATRLVALSSACAEPLIGRGFTEIATASSPGEMALLQLLSP